MSVDTDLVLTRKEAAVIVAALHDFYAARQNGEPEFWEWIGISHEDVLDLAAKIHNWSIS